MSCKYDVYLALPEVAWQALKTKAIALAREANLAIPPHTLMDHVDDERSFDLDGEDWIMVHWQGIWWGSQYQDVALIEQYLDNQDVAFDFVIIGDEIDRYDQRCQNINYRVFSLRPSVDVLI